MVKKSFARRKFIVLLQAVLVSLSLSYVLSGCSYDTKNKELIEEVENAADAFVKANEFNGTILVAKDGKILINKSYGYARFDDKTMITPQTRFMIGSITKQFTAMAIMQLQEKGLLSVEDKVDKYASGIPNSDKITIHHLLTHTSGLPREIQMDTQPSSLSEAVEMVKTMEFPKYPDPGKYYSYSNAGYILLGYIIEKASGISYKEYLQKNIFDPLEMKNSGFGYDRRKDNKLALGYETNMDCLTKESFIDMSVWPHAAGAIYSTTEDLYKWDRALYTNKLVSEKSVEKIFTPAKNDYGYGWFIRSENGKRFYWHDGRVFGFNAYIARRVDEDICIVALSNVESFKGASNVLEGNIMNVLNLK